MKLINILTVLIIITTPFTGCVMKGKNDQKDLGYRSANILEVEGLKFKDLNENGLLDQYEDWRLPTAERAKNLLSMMTIEEKAGMLLIADIRMGGEANMISALGIDTGETPVITTDFNEEDIVSVLNQFTGEELKHPVMNAVGTTKGIKNFKLRHYIFRTNTPADSIAKWANTVQELAESDRLGIPVLFASNPRNHISGATLGTTQVVSEVFSQWPTELGLAAMDDPEMVRHFAEIARQEWLAVGIRKGYMYMADLATEPRWQRIEGTFGENTERAAAIIREIVLGFQGDSLNSSSIALTIKHFPGGGATENGFDPHYSYGRNEVFPAGMFENNLIPFKAAIDAGASAIMPYYSLPKGTKYEEVAYAYNKGILSDLLRGELGFRGIINSDTGPIDAMPWGVEDLSIEERYAKALEAGTNMFAGNADHGILLKAIKSGIVDMKFVDESVFLLLTELFDLGLFENPYVDEAKASSITGSYEFQKIADEAQRKSIVMLHNESETLPVATGTKVYFEIYSKPYAKSVRGGGDVYIPDSYTHFEFVDTPEEAEVILLWLKPAMRPLFPADDSPLQLSLSQCAVDVNYVNSLVVKKPTILAINLSNPFVINEIWNEQSKQNYLGLFATFGNTPEALLDVVSGKFNPTGKLPVTLPVSDEAVTNNKEDLPGYLEPEGYALFDFGTGLSYN